MLNIDDPNFINKLKEPRILDSKYLPSYLAGILEADGCIHLRNENGGGGIRVVIHFAFSKDDLIFAEF
jgi:hypothetical protein